MASGESYECEYRIYRQTPSWTCNITLFPIIDTITVQSPNGGETVTIGTAQPISWDSEGKVTNVDLAYSADNGSTWLPIGTVENTGSYSWTIPDTPSSECLLKVTDADNSNVFDVSDSPFMIQPAYPILTSPNGGQEFYTGTTRTVYWNTEGTIPTILVEYSSDNGNTWNAVDPPNTGNTGSYRWQVPHEVSDECLIRVSDSDNLSASDVSDAPFAIVASYPNVWMPSGGESLLTGDAFDIRWSTAGSIENVAIDFSTDGGTTWQPVDPANTGNTGQYSWQVPYQVSNNCLVRISDAELASVNDISASFQIVSSLPNLLSPRGGERFLSGSTIPVKWETDGVIDEVLIEYSLDNGTSWAEVTPSNVGNNGTYDWVIPYESSDECLIRVCDASNPAVFDVSKSAFEIRPILLKSPQSGESVLVNSDHTIEWSTGDMYADSQINIQHSFDKGESWIDLGTVANSGIYQWTVPEVESNQCLVYVAVADNSAVNDISKDTFLAYRCYEQLSGDLDGDCVVDLADLALLAESWMSRGRTLVKEYVLDEDPGWSLEGQWQFGEPLGWGGISYGYTDPNSGYTGANVYGINLEGDYDTALGGPFYLTTPAIDCSHLQPTKISFMSWLNVDSADYVQCRFEVSTDATEWQTVWENGPEAVANSEWQQMEVDVGEYVTAGDLLYLRWSYQVVDRAYPYSGWNIDDVRVWGVLQSKDEK
ncbi:Ser-Thr-rich glycosyl-phosphatidyl-inositol-anchored membrane family protein [Anaerohalosphaera lusitana]|uniref:Ser-Thr-rich glycosyl-phosphatidyl-inositol-anchored membrane family protein n=1 Tax=Anaerohalosphaera lusitana TaxID=1936003 RepID=A0A1U9NR94_9BACT|nr:hypothetical protein [Anaerohalosphaera lusitana]AQT70046.1 Ser-Thr-rich glycosyl-phosphatidyl-inositol-anchored membrane family protein [Anaerohalosphaera lusitana]